MKIDTKIVIESTDGFIPETFVIVLYEAGLLTYSYLSFTPSHRILTVANVKDIFKSLQHRVVLLIHTVFPLRFNSMKHLYGYKCNQALGKMIVRTRN